MRSLRLRAAVLSFVIVSAPAFAADINRYGPRYAPAPYAAYNWTGAYFGLNLGYQWGSVTNLPVNPSGFVGGAQLGYNWQVAPQVVIGAEVDLQASGAEDRFGPFNFSNPWFSTLRGRGGIAMNNVLLYLTAGLAFGGTKLEVGAASESNTELGWTVGAGIEVGFASSWTAKAEFLYVDLADSSYVLTGVSHGLDSGVMRLGVNYRF